MKRDQERMSVLAAEILRLLKMLFFCSAEHLRSSDGVCGWTQAHQRALDFATAAEADELLEEARSPPALPPAASKQLPAPSPLLTSAPLSPQSPHTRVLMSECSRAPRCSPPLTQFGPVRPCNRHVTAM